MHVWDSVCLIEMMWWDDAVRYHYDGTARPFFEGWYFKVSIPECRQSFCFMYSVENPLFRDGMSDLDRVIHGSRFTGVGAQILGADDKYICQFTEKSNNFWGSKLLFLDPVFFTFTLKDISSRIFLFPFNGERNTYSR